MTGIVEQAESLLAAGRVADGIAMLEPETRRHPERFQAWYCLGRAYGLAGRLPEAEAAFRAAVRLRPDQHDAHYSLALMLAHQSKLRDSVECFVNARRINPRNPEFQKTLFPILVTLLQQGGAPDTARARPLPPLAEAPLVSVVVPTLNRPGMLRDALESVCRQKHENWEAIVVNDGGVDIAPMLNTFSSDMRRKIRRIDLPVTGGPAAARNAAIKVAKGEVLAFLDDDDLHAPCHLQCLIAGLRVSRAGFACTEAELVRETLRDAARVELGRQPFLPGLRYSRPLLLVRNYIPINTWGVRRECFAEAGLFDEALHYLEDWDFLLRLSARVDFHRMTDSTAEYRVTEGSSDSLTKRHRHRQAVQLVYQRHDPGGLEWVELARELYLETLA